MLGLALSCGSTPSVSHGRAEAVFAPGVDHTGLHAVISNQVYSFDPALEEAAFDLGATRWQVFREVTLPVPFPGIFSGALFAFLLSWGNFPLSLYTTGADTTLPEYLYAKMIAGYTPGVPVLGTVSTIGAAFLLIGSYGLILAMRRARQSASE